MKIIRPTTISTEGSFTRASTGTYFNSAGTLVTAAIDELRIGYNPSTLGFLGSIIEEQRTNLLTYSEQFDNAAWVKVGGAAVASNTTLAPDGTTTADTLTVSSSKQVFQPAILQPAGTYCFSCFVKSTGASQVYIQLNVSGVVAASGIDINFTAKTVSVRFGPPVAFGVIDCGNGWLRPWVVLTSNATASVNGYIVSASDETVFAWGAQLEASNSVTSYIPTVASQVTRAADVITGTGLIYSSIPENDYAEWNAATSYTIGDRVIRTSTHRIYENLIAGINATTPELAPTRWLDVSPTNRYAMFDEKIGTESTYANEITVVLKPGRVNSIALLALSASIAEIALFADNQVVYSGSANLIDGTTIGDWYQYFYEPIVQVDTLITEMIDTALLNLPAYTDTVLTLRLKYPTNTVKLGVLVAGISSYLGSTQYDATLGIIDYSIKDVDAFGNIVVTPRTYSKRMNTDLFVENSTVDNVAKILSTYRTTPLVWVATDNQFSSLVVYGFYRDWEITIKGPTRSTLRLDIEGLT